MQPYSYNDLSSDCLQFLEAIRDFSYPHYLFCKTAYDTGCRFSELKDRDRWLQLPNQRLSFQPAKDNAPRKLHENDLPEDFILMLSSGNWYFDRIDYSTLKRYFKRFYPAGPVFVNLKGKGVLFYVFRYRKIKSLALQGLTITEIAEYMGEIDTKNITLYVDAELYTK